MEPERTERIALSSPFSMRRRRTGDAFNAIEASPLFRVNGSNRVGVAYRLLVIGVNVCFGVLSGLKPLLPRGSVAAKLQTVFIFLLLLLMSFICLRCLRTPTVSSAVSPARNSCARASDRRPVGR